jgi:glycosyltransferase involved in cell wall biosynthesis
VISEFVSVVIATYNGFNKIKSILDSLLNQTYTNFEIIVSIDGSTDDTFEYLLSRKKDIKQLIILNNSNGGRAICRNRGAKSASGSILVFLDDDMRATPTLISQHVNFHQQHSSSIVVGATFEDYNLSKTDIQKYRAYLSRKWSKGKKTKLNEPYISAANFSIKKDLFVSLGGFDENLKDAEDYDLAITAIENKISIYFDPEIIGYHDDYITCVSYIKRLREYTSAQERLKLIKPDRYINKYPFRSSIKLTYFVKTIYSLFSNPFFVNLIDCNIFKYLPQFLKYKIYDIVITGLGVYFINRKME